VIVAFESKSRVTFVAVGAVLTTTAVVTANGSDSVPIVAVAFNVVALLAADVPVMAMVSPLFTTVELTHVLMPLTTNTHNVVVAVTCVFTQATVMVLVVKLALGVAFTMSVKLNGFGVLSTSAFVVTEKISVKLPMLTCPFNAVAWSGDAVPVIATVSPLLMVDEVAHVLMPLITNVHKVAVIVTGVFIPDTVMVFVVKTALGTTPDTFVIL